MQIFGAGLDAVAVGLKPFVVLRGDPVTEDVDGLRLALEADRQLLGDEHVGQMRDRQRPVDRVVVGDRHEVHAPALGELVDLLPGSVAHSGSARERWIPSFDSSDAVECTCMSTLLTCRSVLLISCMGTVVAYQALRLVKFAVLRCEVPVNCRTKDLRNEQFSAMPDHAASPDLVLERGQLRAEVTLRPFSFTIRRAGRRLLRNAGAWVADGTVHDHFIQFTEGVVAAEDLAPHERAIARDGVRDATGFLRLARTTSEPTEAIALGLLFEGGRKGA